MKDRFSAQAANYASFRPLYPPELFLFLSAHLHGREAAWDCGTGNGQLARQLADYVDRVFATDISAGQLERAPLHERIEYSVQPAESTTFTANSFDLICAAQAVHWFDTDKFYSEARRTAKPQALLALIGYGLIETFAEADRLLSRYYRSIVGSFWDPERRHVEQHYSSLALPFPEIETPALEIRDEWDLTRLKGYLRSWSATVRYREQKGRDPLQLISGELDRTWGEKHRPVRFPLFVRAARIVK